MFPVKHEETSENSEPLPGAADEAPPRTGDAVLVASIGEKWLVRRVVGDRVECFGWPKSQAPLADCTVVRRSTDEQHVELIGHLDPDERAAQLRLPRVPPGQSFEAAEGEADANA